MSEFKPVDIKKYLQTPIKAVDKTDKTGFVSFVKQNLPVIDPEKKGWSLFNPRGAGRKVNAR